MDVIGRSEIWSFVEDEESAKVEGNSVVRASAGHYVESFMELATKVAELQFRNRDFVLLFRGQANDYKNQKGFTSLKPTLLRGGVFGNPDPLTLIDRFDELSRAERLLIDAFSSAKLLGADRLKRHQILRWSILQHYEMAPTPLLDVTHSLRIAASFASIGSDGEAFLYVLGVPNLSGSITASAEAGLQVVRLSSVSPPSAMRPHIQEGYLLGEYPDMAQFEQRELYQHAETDFGRRLVAKFRFTPNQFWRRDGFPQIGIKALYPSSKDDVLHGIAESIKQQMKVT